MCIPDASQEVNHQMFTRLMLKHICLGNESRPDNSKPLWPSEHTNAGDIENDSETKQMVSSN